MTETPIAGTEKTAVKLAWPDLLQMKREGRKIPVLTCYDHPTAKILTAAGVRALLVGDSAAMTVLGYDSTIHATMDFMVTITAAVRRGAPDCFLMADMPFGSYPDAPTATRNALRFLQESHADIVKMECDHRHEPIVQALSAAGIPLCAHLGLLPQKAAFEGAYRAQGRTPEAAAKLVAQAQRLAAAGTPMLLLEAVPDAVSAQIVAAVPGVVIGCGAGASCDGHVVVLHDVLGFNARPARFVEVLTNVPERISHAARQYFLDVTQGRYPASRHAYHMKTTSPGE